jgi:amidohydrolase
VFCEYDALPEIGHACGHNLIAISGLATGIGLKAALGEGNGTVVVFGSPAEEGGGGKVLMLERGALEGIDAAMMLHPSPVDAAWAHMVAVERFKVAYHGRNAHAGAFPWEGVNALDAVVMAYNGISVMRQQLRPTDRVHGVITKGGVRPNIIPDHTEAEFYVRAKNVRHLEDAHRKVMACFEAAATATGCTMETEPTGPSYLDVNNNDVMASAYVAHMQEFEMVLPTKAEQGGAIAGGSTDMGNVSYEVPSIHPTFAIPSEAANHTAGFTAAAASEEAHRATLRASKALALTALDLYLEPGRLAAAHAEFRAGSAAANGIPV